MEKESSNVSQFLVIGVIIVAAIAVVWLLLPPGLGIKTQIESMVGGILFWSGIGLGALIWVIEALILFIGSWILGFVHIIKRFDELISPKHDLEDWERRALYVPASVLVFLLWMLIAYFATIVPPISQNYIGPWIASHIETGLVWWGFYGWITWLIFNGIDVS